MSTELIPRQTLSQMADAYKTAQEEIEEAYKLLTSAKTRLKETFKDNGYRFDFDVALHSRRYSKVHELLHEVKKDVWKVLIERMELRKLMSIDATQKLDKQLETGEGMPEITLLNLIAMIEGAIARVPQMIEEAIKEVYEFLRPRGSRLEYKTNQKSEFELKEKLILCSSVTRSYNNVYDVGGYREPHIRAIDNVFHALDGKGMPKGYFGPLTEAIKKTPCRGEGAGLGETEYFRFKCFKNQNLHLEFKRLDLLAKFNQVAGGMRLKP